MNNPMPLPPPVESYLHSINTRNQDTFSASFAPDAVVQDVSHEFRGIAAIDRWAREEIFAVNVTLEVVKASAQNGQTIVAVKVDGTFDRTGLPDPLLMDHCFTVANGKITALECKFSQAQPA